MKETSSTKTAAQIAEDERIKRELAEEDFRRRQEAYKKKQEEIARKQKELDLKAAQAKKTPQNSAPVASRIETEIRMRYANGTYHLAFFGINTVNDDAYEVGLIPRRSPFVRGAHSFSYCSSHSSCRARSIPP